MQSLIDDSKNEISHHCLSLWANLGFGLRNRTESMLALCGRYLDLA